MDSGALDQKIAQLLALAPQLDSATAQFLLESTQGNVEQALGLYEDHASAVRPMQPTSANRDPPPRPRAPAAVPQGIQQRRPLLAGLARGVLWVPATLLTAGLGLALSGISLGVAVAGYFGDRMLPARVMTGLRGALTTLTSPPEDLDPQSQARRFVQSFKAKYGDRHPRFLESGFKQAVTQAKSDFKFTFVYLHSSEHQDSDRFCEQVLCAPEVVTYVNEHFVSWGGDVRYADAYQLSGRLSVTGYPYIALLNTTPSNQVQLVAQVQGFTSALSLLAKLTQAVERHGAVLVAQRAELQEREFARQLREEQNAEYERSLAADREREAQRQAQRQQEEQEQRQKDEAEAKARAELEAEERRKADLARSIEQRRQDKRTWLPPEPEAHSSPSAGSSQQATALVRLRLPDGGSTQRRFLATHRMHHIFDFVDSLDSTNYLRYTLVSSYPRKVFSREEADLTLQEAGLAPQAALFVQPDADEAGASGLVA